MNSLRALVVDDDDDMRQALCQLLEAGGFEASGAGSLAEARKLIESTLADIALVDLQLPDGSGLELLDPLTAAGTDMILVTGNATVDTAVQAFRDGVTDYLVKPVDVPHLESVLGHVARARDLKQSIARLRDELLELGRFGPLVGASEPMRAVYKLIEKAAPTDVPVFITGESGTGKEEVARALHMLSPRKSGPFIAVNCGAITESLVESEVFGHEKGSFTGAVKQRRGHFELADGGTLFLDEIGEMPIELQVKMLRVLETNTFQRVGGEQSITSNVRILSATNREPKAAVEQGKLRQDLLYRLNIFHLRLPPLRDRAGDVELLADHFLAKANAKGQTRKRFRRATVDALLEHPWPGNVRELRNVVDRAFIVADDDIGPECLPIEVGTEEIPEGDAVRIRIGSSIADAEKKIIVATLGRNGGDKKKTAEILGVSLKTLYNRLNAYAEEDGSEPAGDEDETAD